MRILIWFILDEGYGKHFQPLIKELKNFCDPSNACGWDLSSTVRHCHVLSRLPAVGCFTTVNVQEPGRTHLDHFKRVSFVFMV